jgi:hypothetical protein
MMKSTTLLVALVACVALVQAADYAFTGTGNVQWDGLNVWSTVTGGLPTSFDNSNVYINNTATTSIGMSVTSVLLPVNNIIINVPVTINLAASAVFVINGQLTWNAGTIAGAGVSSGSSVTAQNSNVVISSGSSVSTTGATWTFATNGFNLATNAKLGLTAVVLSGANSAHTVATGAQVTVNSGISTISGTVTVNGNFYVAAGAQLTANVITFASTGSMTVQAATTGFVATTYNGACSFNGAINIVLNGYSTTTKVLIATCNGGISSQFNAVLVSNTPIEGIADASSRRLLAAGGSGSVTYSGNAMYYDPNASNAASSVTPNVFAAVALVVMAVFVNARL